MRDGSKEQIDQLILDLYKEHLKNLTPLFPINPQIVFLITMQDSCRVVSYQALARKNETDVRTIINAFGSEDGCTHYDCKTRRYLVAYNRGVYKPRIRWTIAHECGHILCGHFLEVEASGRREIPDDLWQNMEEEADYFAASLLAPIPAIRKCRASSVSDISRIFGLSGAAARYRWSEFLQNHECSELDDVFSEYRVGIHHSAVKKPSYIDDYRSDTELLRLESLL